MNKSLSWLLFVLSAGLNWLSVSTSLAADVSQATVNISRGEASHKLHVQRIDLALKKTDTGSVQDIRDAFSTGLPLAAEWNVGVTGQGWTPTYQVTLIRKGYRILPTLHNPLPRGGNNPKKIEQWLKAHRAALEQLREWNLPICLRSHNWLDVFNAKPPSKYRVPFEQLDDSPLAWRIDEDGEPDDRPIVDPMGPTSRWLELGIDVATTLWVKAISEIYPDPPMIYFLENNEGARLKPNHFYIQAGKMRILKPENGIKSRSLRFWHYLEDLEAQGKSLPDYDETKLLFADFYVEKYKTFTATLKSNAPESWQGRILVGGFGGASTYRGRGHVPWQYDSVFEKYGFSTAVHGWDIVSPPAYINHWDNSWDNWIRSPQIQAMSLGIQFREFASRNPDWFAEISVWSGAPKRHWALWRKFRQIYSPQRYKGYVQQILWQSRIKGRGFILRQFDGYRTDPKDAVLKQAQYAQLPDGTPKYTFGDYWLAVADAVRVVHETEVLREFWLRGEPIINPVPEGHYFKWILPDGYTDNRWQLLDSNANPPRSKWPKKLGMMELAVYAIAYRLQDIPNNILLYVWSPLGPSNGVMVEVPGVGPVRVDTDPGGHFYLLLTDNRLPKG